MRQTDLPPKVVELAYGLVQRLSLVIPTAFQIVLDGEVVGISFNGKAEAEQGIDLHYASESEREDLANIAYQIMSTTQDVVVERTTNIWPTSDVTQISELPLPETDWSGDVLHAAFVYESEVILELSPLRFTEPF